MVKGTNTNASYFDMQAFNCSTTLQSAASSLALSVNDPGTNLALTGQRRTITITNSGSVTAGNVKVQSVSGLPTNTIVSSTTCQGDLAPGSSCTVTIEPGSVRQC
jgi:uncharacterized repeat protein (TIGR01451 family)